MAHKPIRPKCMDCSGTIEGWRNGKGGAPGGPRCLPCLRVWQTKHEQELRIRKLCGGVDVRFLLPRHKGKR